MSPLLFPLPGCKQEQKDNSEFRKQVEGGAFDNYETPFGFGASEGINRGKFESTWVVELEVPEAFEVSILLLLFFYFGFNHSFW